MYTCAQAMGLSASGWETGKENVLFAAYNILSDPPLTNCPVLAQHPGTHNKQIWAPTNGEEESKLRMYLY